MMREWSVVTYLEQISHQEKRQRLNDLVMICLLLIAGVLLGLFSKYIDSLPEGYLPILVENLRIDRLMSRMPIWLCLALTIALYSRTPLKASISVFLFFSGLIGSYYWYSAVVLGIFSSSKIIYWLWFTLLSPVLAYLCWYVNLKNKFSLFLSVCILLVLAYYTFIDGLRTFGQIFLLDILVFIVACIIIKIKETKKQLIL